MKDFRGVQRLDQVRNVKTCEQLAVLAYVSDGALFVQETEVLTRLDLAPKNGWLRQEGRNLADVEMGKLNRGDVLKREHPKAIGEYRVQDIVRDSFDGQAMVIVTRSMVIIDPENWVHITR